MNLFDRFVLFYVSWLPVLFGWMARKGFPSFFIEIVCYALFSRFFCQLKYKILLRSSAR